MIGGRRDPIHQIKQRSVQSSRLTTSASGAARLNSRSRIWLSCSEAPVDPRVPGSWSAARSVQVEYHRVAARRRRRWMTSSLTCHFGIGGTIESWYSLRDVSSGPLDGGGPGIRFHRSCGVDPGGDVLSGSCRALERRCRAVDRRSGGLVVVRGRARRFARCGRGGTR